MIPKKLFLSKSSEAIKLPKNPVQKLVSNKIRIQNLLKNITKLLTKTNKINLNFFNKKNQIKCEIQKVWRVKNFSISNCYHNLNFSRQIRIK